MTDLHDIVASVTDALKQTAFRVLENEKHLGTLITRVDSIEQQVSYLATNQQDIILTQRSMLNSMGQLTNTVNNLANTVNNLAVKVDQFIQQAEEDRATIKQMQMEVKQMQTEVRGIQIENQRIIRHFFGETDNPELSN